MFSSAQSFIRRHKYKFIFGGIAIGGVVLILDYAKKVWKESQDRETKEILERNKKHQHYEGTEEICNKTAKTAAITLNNRIADSLKATDILNLLRNDPYNKVQLWQQLMVLSFTKVVALVYASAFVMILLRVQLNLLGGYIFRDSADGTERLDSVSQDKYLSTYNNLFNNGINPLIRFIKQKVEKILKNKSLKDEMTIRDIERVFFAIQESISRDIRDPCKMMATYCLGDTDKWYLQNHNDRIFNRIMAETRDILESSEIHTLAQSAVVSNFACVMDHYAEYFVRKCTSLKGGQKNGSSYIVGSTSSGTSTPSDDKTNEFDRFSISLPMARIIPLVSDIVPDSHKANVLADTLMLKLTCMESLKVMGANVYEAFSSDL